MNHRPTRRPLLLAAILALLAGCGQKGPLYLPDEPEQSVEPEQSGE